MYSISINVLLISFLLLIPVQGNIETQPTTSSNSRVGYQTKDKRAVTQCKESDSRCDGICYRKLDLCDGWQDCEDGTDEDPDLCKDAPNITTFECYNGKVIDISQVCDGIADCKDKADEDDSVCNDETAENCTIPNSSTLRVQCEYKGMPIPCEYEVRAWANLKIFCNVGYVPKNSTTWIDTNKCRNSGKLIHKVPHCTFDCGTPAKQSYPWNVIVYERSRKYYNRRCLGILVTPYHVVTDYKCTYTKPSDTSLEERLKIGMELLSGQSERYRYDEPHPLIGVVDIETYNYDRYKGSGNYNDDPNPYLKDTKSTHNYKSNQFCLTVLQIKTPFDLQEYRPACFDLGRKLKIDSYSTGKVVMKFGSDNTNTSHKLYKFGDLLILSHEDCKNYLQKYNFEEDYEDGYPQLKPEEFCAIYDSCGANCTRRPEILGGSGLFVNENDRYYLLGLFVGTIHGWDNEERSIQVYVFSDVRVKKLWKHYKGSTDMVNVAEEKIKYLDYSLLSRHTHYWSRDCSVPYTIGGIYSENPCLSKNRNCTELLTHRKMAEGSVIYIHCKENFKLKGSCNYIMCQNKVWYPEVVTCVRLCDPLVTKGNVKIDCSYEDKNVSCVEQVMAETVATSICDSDGLIKDLTTYNNTCLHSGNWRDSPEVIEILCIDLCGILKSERPLIQNGEEANSIYHPWNVGLYYKYKEGHFIHICGGTLISKFAVLSAAHCVQAESDQRLGAEMLEIGLGKFYRKYNDSRDLTAQYLQVQNVYVPNLYDGASSAYVADIAILELKSAAILNDFVVPACIDTSNKFSVRNYNIGSVVGWGYNGTGKDAIPTDALMKAELPYLNRQMCLNKSNEEFNITIRITIDKFCAFHFKDGKPIVRRGDSGSGITFKFQGRHYVYGLVSIQANNLTSMFTNITYPDHLEFINRVLNQIVYSKTIPSEK